MNTTRDTLFVVKRQGEPASVIRARRQWAVEVSNHVASAPGRDTWHHYYADPFSDVTLKVDDRSIRVWNAEVTRTTTPRNRTLFIFREASVPEVQRASNEALRRALEATRW